VDKAHGPNGKHWGELGPQVMNLLPTPHGMAKEGQARRPGPTGNELGRALTLLPTPRSSDMNGAGEHGQGGMDLRAAVKLATAIHHQPGGSQSSGASTSPPSADGKPSTGLRLNPSFVGWMMGTPSCGECGREWTDPGCPHSATEYTSTSAGSSAMPSASSNGGGVRLLPTPRADPRDMTPRTPREDWRPSLMEAVMRGMA
jgi:hypothetical protein